MFLPALYSLPGGMECGELGIAVGTCPLHRVLSTGTWGDRLQQQLSWWTVSEDWCRGVGGPSVTLTEPLIFLPPLVKAKARGCAGFAFPLGSMETFPPFKTDLKLLNCSKNSRTDT